MSVFEKSKFIWARALEGADTYAEFYNELQIAGKTAICNISCDGDYTLFINGKFVSCNQYGDFEHYKVYDEIDLSPYVQEGKNHFALICWHFGENSSRYKKYAPGVIFEVIENGHVVLASNEDILSRKSKAYQSSFKRLISSQLGFSYRYDATKEDAWMLGLGVGMEKSVISEKNCTFFARPVAKLSLGAPVYGKLISECSNTLIYDLGREYVGLLSLKLHAKSECEINIAYGECLENGHVKRKIGIRDFSVDYIASSGDNEYTNYMLRLSCRYLEISTQGSVSFEEIGVIPQFYKTDIKDCSFLTGIDKQIYDICVRTLELCMMEHYVDCPWREQCLYAFDSRNQMICGYYALEGGNFKYARANLYLMGMDRREDGLLSICSPCGIDLTIPSFSLHYIVALKEYTEHSGDTSLARELKPKIKQIIDTFLAKIENGLIKIFGERNYWNFYDWSDLSDGALWQSVPPIADAVINFLAVIALNAYKSICERCDIRFEYSSELDALKKRAKEAFFDPKSGLFFMSESVKKHTELVNSLAIIAGLCTKNEARHICEEMKNGALVPCSLSMRCFKYDALLLCNKNKYRDFVLNQIRADYEKMIPVGTVWETDKGEQDFDNAGSLCHGWSAIPIYYYHLLLK